MGRVLFLYVLYGLWPEKARDATMQTYMYYACMHYLHSPYISLCFLEVKK